MMWGNWGISMMLMMLLFGAAIIVAVVLLIRGLLTSGQGSRRLPNAVRKVPWTSCKNATRVGSLASRNSRRCARTSNSDRTYLVASS